MIEPRNACCCCELLLLLVCCRWPGSTTGFPEHEHDYTVVEAAFHDMMTQLVKDNPEWVTTASQRDVRDKLKLRLRKPDRDFQLRSQTLKEWVNNEFTKEVEEEYLTVTVRSKTNKSDPGKVTDAGYSRMDTDTYEKLVAGFNEDGAGYVQLAERMITMKNAIGEGEVYEWPAEAGRNRRHETADREHLPQFAEMMWDERDDPGYFGKTAGGAILRIPRSVTVNGFTLDWLEMLQRVPNRFCKIPVGRRTNSLPPLPDGFPQLHSACLLSQPGKSKCCVGFGLAAAMCALDDHNWTRVASMAPVAVVEVEQHRLTLLNHFQDPDSSSTAQLAFSVEDELDWFKMWMMANLPSTYEIKMFGSTFSPSVMEEDDIALCQLRTALESTAHAFALYRERIYDAAETRSMPLQAQYLDRCTRENIYDKDSFAGYKRVMLLRPKPNLLRAIKRKRKRPNVG